MLTLEARAAVEEHLPRCAGCLQQFLELKRAIETTADAGPRPSPRARVLLRLALTEELGARSRRSGWYWGGVAAAALMAATLLGIWSRPAPSPVQTAPVEARPSSESIDSAQPAPANLHFI
jgi:hypothetical protein